MPGQVSPLGKLIDRRRAELGLKLRDFADAAGLSVEALRAIRYGENEPRGLTMGAIDRGLHWEPGSAERFIAGGTPPVPLVGPSPEPDRAAAAAVLFPGDTVAQAIMAQEHKPEEQRRRELGKWLTGEGAAEA